MTPELLAFASVAAGAVLVAIGVRARTRPTTSVALLPLIGRPEDPPADLAAAASAYGTVVSGTLGLANRAIERTRSSDALRVRLERADLSLRPSELVVIAACGAIAVGALVASATGWLWALAVAVLAAPVATSVVLDRLAARRSRRFAEQLPDALVIVASSLRAGHTFLRSIQLLAEEAERPLADELRRVVSETQLGAPLVDSLERMSDRVRNRDVEWMVQAIRIQQQVGGRLTELMMTLAEVMRSRDELRREVRVLTAEGRASAWVLGALPVALFVAVSVANPGYLDPMLQGWGPVVLAVTALAMAAGIAIILRMVRQVER